MGKLTFRELIYDICGGVPGSRKVKAFYPGGSSAPVLTGEQLDIRIDYESIAAAGSMLGSGGLIVMDDTVDMVWASLNLAKFYHHESCGKCTPCREGSGWMVDILEHLYHQGGRTRDIEIVGQISQNLIGKSFCLLGDSLGMPVGSAVQKFPNDFTAHLESPRWREGANG